MQKMELHLELALSSNPGNRPDPNQGCSIGGEKKRRTSEDADFPPLLPLSIRGESNRNDEFREGFVVGWPPLKSWRKQLCHHNRRRFATNYVNVENSGCGGGGRRGSNSMYVKVKMEGIGITRKLDLSVHRSYRTLFAHLASLFGKCEENMQKYKLIYQNKEGDWLHATDVPWESFIRLVQRLRLEKNGY